MRSVPITAALRCLAAALLFGVSTPLSKLLLGSLGPFTLAGLLYLGAAAGVSALALRGRSTMLWSDGRQRLMLAGAVVFGGVLGPVFLLLGLKAAAAASVSLWLNLETVATTALAWALFRENLGGRIWTAAGLVVLASLILTLPSGAGTLWSSAGTLWAGALIALACVCWGIDNNLTALVSGFTPAQTTFVKGIAGGAVNLAIGLALDSSRTGGGVVGLALLLGALSYGVSILLYISGAQELGAARSQLLFSTSPFLGMSLSWILLREPVQTLQLFAASVMVVGLYLMLTGRHEHEHTHGHAAHVHSHRHDDGHHTHVHPGLPADARHTHPHEHPPITHRHPHLPDLHHRHRH